MFDFGLSELLLTAVIALIVLGPERLPKAARTAGRLAGKMQRLAASVKQELGVQAELEELRKAKQEFEAAAVQLREEMQELGNEAQNSLNEVSDGLKPWERLPTPRTPEDFDADGNLLFPSEEGCGTPEGAQSDADQAWRDYLTAVRPSEMPQVSYSETLPAARGTGLHTPTLHRQAMQRKRDLRPKFRAKPKLRVRKK